MGRPPGTTVFVGNISYDTTEDQLKDVFSQVGNVVSFRLMYDHDTGRAKGFGFCEYEDKETAMSARRNLNGTQLNGRPLRVDLTDSDKNNPALNSLALNQPVTNKPVNTNPAINPPANVHHMSQPNQLPMRQHPALPPALASANPSMAMMSLADIHKTMILLKKAVVQNPNEMRELLMANPRLAHAILQGQIMLGMVPPPMMPPPPQQQHAKRVQPPMQQQTEPPRQPMPPHPNIPSQRPAIPPPRPNAPPRPNVPAQRPPPQQQPHPPMQQMPMQGQNGPPPNMMPPRMMQPPPPQPMQMQGLPAQGQQPPSQANMDEQAAILSRVMTMTQQEIDALPVEHRNQVLEIKQILSMQNAGGMPPGVNQPMMSGMPPGGQGAPPPPPPPPSVGQGQPPPQQQYR